MRPLTALNAIILGSCLAIAISLAMVLIVFALLRGDYPRLQSEYPALIDSLLIFLVMTAISAASFYSLIRNFRAWWVPQLLMWCGIFVTGTYYWSG